MTPDTVAAIGTIAKVIDLVQGWPLWLIVVLLVAGPWLAVIYVTRCADKRAADHDLKSAENLAELKKITEEGWKAYAANVELLKVTQDFCRREQGRSETLTDILLKNTAVLERLTILIERTLKGER